MTTPIPHVRDLMWPVLQALKAQDGSGTVSEIYHRVVEDEGFGEDQQAVLTKNGKMPLIQYRLHWARTNLKGIGPVENSARGVWAITEKGAALSREELRNEVKAWLADAKANRVARQSARPAVQADADAPGEDDPLEELTWKEQVLEKLLQISPGRFERLALREPRSRFALTRSNIGVRLACPACAVDGRAHCRGRIYFL